MKTTLEILPVRGVHAADDAFARDVCEGLAAAPKRLPSRYFYDERGSRLFQQITELEEYYPTRCEREILETYRDEIARRVAGERFRLIELGAGDGHKTEVLLQRFAELRLDFDYVPIDICEQAVVGLAAALERRMPVRPLRIHGLVAEYFDALRHLGQRGAERNVVLFLGSNIGNFSMPQAHQFLSELRGALHTGDLVLIGFDLKKDLDILQRAYFDTQGITSEFNYNLLDRINRELGGNFDRDRFLHYAPYNPAEGCMESWLVSTAAQEVEIRALDRTFAFTPWEGIHVECSYKYDEAEIAGLAAGAGFSIARQFFDRRGWFTDSLWRAEPPRRLARHPR